MSEPVGVKIERVRCPSCLEWVDVSLRRVHLQPDKTLDENIAVWQGVLRRECDNWNAHAKITRDLTADEVRALADAVQPGECVTFPNGLVVDKRPVAFPMPWPINPNATVPAQPWNPQYPGPPTYPTWT